MLTSRSRVMRLLALLFAVALFATACGDSGSTTTAATTTTAAAVTTSTAAAATTMAPTTTTDPNDLGGRTITVGVENAYLPFNYVPVGSDAGQGWDYDAWNAICGVLNCQAEFITAGWPAVIDQVAQGELDTAADGISITEERAKIVAYSQAYMTVDQKFIVGKADDRFKSADDIINSNARVGTQVGTTNYELATKLLNGDSRIDAFDQFGLAIQALINGDVDAVIIDDAAGQGYVGENADSVKIIDDPLQADPLGFIFPLDSALVGPVNYALSQLRDNGTLQQLGEKFFTNSFTVTYDDIADVSVGG